MSDDALVVRDVYKRFDRVEALRGVSLSVATGSLTGLVGSDGAGKTTLIRIVAGLLVADSGTVTVVGRNSGGDRTQAVARPAHTRAAHARATVGYLSQGFSLYSDLSIDENMRFFGELYGIREFRDRRTELLTLVGLEPFRARRAGKLSGGMKKKLALACAIIHAPSLLLLDEPTTGVDPVSRREFWSILTRLRHEGMSVLMATPYFDEAERCDRVVLMHDGIAVADGTPEAVSGQTTGTILEIVCTPLRSARELLERDERVREVQMYGDRIHVRVDSPEHFGEGDARAHLTRNGVSVELIRVVRPTLENAFISRMRDYEEAS